MEVNFDWNSMYQQAIEKIKKNESVGSGTYNFVVPVEQDGQTYAVRVAREELANASTPFNDIEMLTNPYPPMPQIIEMLLEEEPRFRIPRLHYVSPKTIGKGKEARPAFAVMDWVPNAIPLAEHPLYQYGSPLPETISIGIDDYIERWTKIPIDRIESPSNWPGSDNRDFAFALLRHAQTQYENALPKYRPLFASLGFTDRPFDRIEKQFSQMRKRRCCFIETDRNVENILLSQGDPTLTPYFIDIDGFKIGDWVYGVKALEHRVGINLLSNNNQRMEQLSQKISPVFTQGWDKDSQAYNHFELIRNTIMRVLVNGKKHLINPQAQLPHKFIACYNEMRAKIWRAPPLSTNDIKQQFVKFHFDQRNMDQPDRHFLDTLRRRHSDQIHIREERE